MLAETEKKDWAKQLWQAAQSPIVSNQLSPLFWFTSSELFFAQAGAAGKKALLFLDQPELVFKKIWIPANSTERLDLSQ